VKQKDSGNKPIFGMLSVHELFYFLFSIGVIITLIFYGWGFLGDWLTNSQQSKSSKSINGKEAADSSAVAISKSQLLYYKISYPNKFSWWIYDSKTDKITDGSYAARALNKAGPFLDTLTNGCDLSGWKGNIVMTARSTNFGFLIFQWKADDNQVQVFKWAGFSPGGKGRSPQNVIAVDNGWLSSPYFAGNKSGVLDITGNQVGSVNFTNPVPKMLQPAPCWPFQGGLFITALDRNTHLSEIYVLSLTNQSLIFSNVSVKMPVAFDDLLFAQPDPSGRRVVWVFVSDAKFSRWASEKSYIPSTLSSALNHKPALYYYSSDLHATHFSLISFVRHADSVGLIWGLNGDSVWLPDTEKGIKQYQLK
jgi:hypothetical protein